MPATASALEVLVHFLAVCLHESPALPARLIRVEAGADIVRLIPPAGTLNRPLYEAMKAPMRWMQNPAAPQDNSPACR
jgi:hypothetical protein